MNILKRTIPSGHFSISWKKFALNCNHHSIEVCFPNKDVKAHLYSYTDSYTGDGRGRPMRFEIRWFYQQSSPVQSTLPLKCLMNLSFKLRRLCQLVNLNFKFLPLSLSMKSAQAALELEFIKLLFKVRNKIQNYFKTFKHFFCEKFC